MLQMFTDDTKVSESWMMTLMCSPSDGPCQFAEMIRKVATQIYNTHTSNSDLLHPYFPYNIKDGRFEVSLDWRKTIGFKWRMDSSLVTMSTGSKQRQGNIKIKRISGWRIGISIYLGSPFNSWIKKYCFVSPRQNVLSKGTGAMFNIYKYLFGIY